VEPTVPNLLARSVSRTLLTKCLWLLFKFQVTSPITTVSLSNKFWGIEESIEYGTTTILSTTADIVDSGAFAAKERKGVILIDTTGTTLTLIATDAFTKYSLSPARCSTKIPVYVKPLLLNSQFEDFELRHRRRMYTLSSSFSLETQKKID
jgi:hypothetical protein